MKKQTLKMIMLLFVLLANNGGINNLKKDQKTLKKDLTHMHFLSYDLV